MYIYKKSGIIDWLQHITGRMRNAQCCYMDLCSVKYLPGEQLKTSSNYASIDAWLTALKLAYALPVYKCVTKFDLCFSTMDENNHLTLIRQIFYPLCWLDRRWFFNDSRLRLDGMRSLKCSTKVQFTNVIGAVQSNVNVHHSIMC